VVYLLHSGDGQYDFWLQSPRQNDPRGTIVPDLVGDFPAIIVMPDAGANGRYMNWWNGGRRGDPGWERYHLDELIPLVERRLKVRRVTYRIEQGSHNYDLGWRSFEAAFRWIEGALGRPVRERPARWRYQTVAQRSNAFGFRFSFAKPPTRLASFSRSACTLQGRGAGRVTVRSPGGKRQRARLPFRKRIC
jgi:hypothetical protein